MRARCKEQIRGIHIYMYAILASRSSLPLRRSPFPLRILLLSVLLFPSYFSLLRHPRAVIECVLLLEFHTWTTGPGVSEKKKTRKIRIIARARARIHLKSKPFLICAEGEWRTEGEQVKGGKCLHYKFH